MASSRRVFSPSIVVFASMVCSVSGVVAGAADVAVARVGTCGMGLGQGLVVQGVLQDRLDAAVGAGPQVQGTGAGRLDPPGPGPAGQADDAQGRAVALLGGR